MKMPLSQALVAVSEWLDDAPLNRERDSEAATWGRLAKVSEEAGEVIRAYIGVTGQNPRKMFTHTESDVKNELLDVAVTALAAYEHMDGHHGTCMTALARRVQYLHARVGINVEVAA